MVKFNLPGSQNCQTYSVPAGDVNAVKMVLHESINLQHFQSNITSFICIKLMVLIQILCKQIFNYYCVNLEM